MKIFVYVTSQPKDLVANLLNRLDKAGVSYFVDKNIPTRNWYESNLEGNCRVFNNVFDYYHKDYPETFIPFVLCAAEHDEDPDWENIKNSLSGQDLDFQTAPVQKQGIKRRAEETFDEEIGKYIERVVPEKKTKDNEHYELETLYDNDHDTMFYQMTKPYEDRSWTSVTKDFAKRGHLPFFSSFFYLQSFGKCGNDIDFLAHCWEKWNMSGSMVIDTLVKNHIEEAEKDETLAPKVYLNDIRTLIDLFNTNDWP